MIFDEIFKEKYKYLTDYFESALQNNNRKMPQSIIFYGLDTLAQYFLSQSLARILNCSENAEHDCGCLNCNWIRENQHPAVVTITNVDNKPSDDETKTVISIAQSRMVKNLIVNTSEYHRVFILCAASLDELNEHQKKSLKTFETLKFKFPQNASGKSWYPQPLSQNILQDEAANALLKSIEEPPQNVTFIFLTRDKEDMISTIVSRSQCFYVPSFEHEIYNLDIVRQLFQNYPELDISECSQIAQNLCEYLKVNEMPLEYLICSMQEYLQNSAKQSLDNKNLLYKIKKDVFLINAAQKQLQSSLKDLNILENLLFGIAKTT